MRGVKVPIEDKIQAVQNVEAMIAKGMKSKDACAKLELNPFDLYRYRGAIRAAEGKSPPVREIVRVDKSTEKMLKAENVRLKTIVAELMLDLSALKEYQAR